MNVMKYCESQREKMLSEERLNNMLSHNTSMIILSTFKSLKGLKFPQQA